MLSSKILIKLWMLLHRKLTTPIGNFQVTNNTEKGMVASLTGLQKAYKCTTYLHTHWSKYKDHKGALHKLAVFTNLL